MLKFKEALSLILESVGSLNDLEEVKISDSLKRVLGEDLYADGDIPPFNRSLADGYALISTDTQEANLKNPIELKVVEEIRAGAFPQKKIISGQAVRIMTGAPLPPEADAVIKFEEVETLNTYVLIRREVKTGENLAEIGKAAKKGELLVSKGQTLEPIEIGILASLGKSRIKVIRQPKVAIFITGDELVEPEEELPLGKIRASNGYLLSALVSKYGGLPLYLGISRDIQAEIQEKIKLAQRADLILTSGGASKGKYDLMEKALRELGAQIKFREVAMRPGGHFIYSLWGEIPLFGLSGSPTALLVSFEELVRPALLKISGKKNADKTEVLAYLEEEIKKEPGFRFFAWASVRYANGKYYARRVSSKSIGTLKSMGIANGLMVIPEEVTHLAPGNEVIVKLQL